jgi:type III secretion system YscJ/HrcJ family lipoprotein
MFPSSRAVIFRRLVIRSQKSADPLELRLTPAARCDRNRVHPLDSRRRAMRRYHLRMVPHRSAVSLALVSCLSIDCTTEVLHHDLREDDANQIVAALHARGIGAHKIRGAESKSFEVTVAARQFAEAARLMRALSLPRPTVPDVEPSGWIHGPDEDRGRSARALSAQVSNALLNLRGVVIADVVVALPERNDLAAAGGPGPSASVLVQYRSGSDDPPPVSTAEVQRFVASAIPELSLDRDRVAVIVQPAPPVPVDVMAESTLESVLGIRVAVDSASVLKIVLGAMALLVLALSAGSAWLLVRLMKSPRAAAAK